MTKSKLIFLMIITFFFGGCATPMQLGLDAFNRGEYDAAAGYWNPEAQAGNPYAEYNLGLLWENGFGSTPKNLVEASEWYLRSANQGYTPAMVKLATIQMKAGLYEAALSWFVLGARWGNNEAIANLIALGKDAPAPDLLESQQRQDTITQAQNAEAAASLGYMLGCALGGGTCSGTATINNTYQPSAISTPPIITSDTPSTSTKQPTYNVYRSSTISTPSTSGQSSDPKSCISDYSCGIGFQCAKAPLQSTGICMQTVDEYRLPQYNLPSGESVGPNLDVDGQCTFDLDCPIGFGCDKERRVCLAK